MGVTAVSILFLLALLLVLLWFFFPLITGVTVRVERSKPQDPETVKEQKSYINT